MWQHMVCSVMWPSRFFISILYCKFVILAHFAHSRAVCVFFVQLSSVECIFFNANISLLHFLRILCHFLLESQTLSEQSHFRKKIFWFRPEYGNFIMCVLVLPHKIWHGFLFRVLTTCGDSGQTDDFGVVYHCFFLFVAIDALINSFASSHFVLCFVSFFPVCFIVFLNCVIFDRLFLPPKKNMCYSPTTCETLRQFCFGLMATLMQ